MAEASVIPTDRRTAPPPVARSDAARPSRPRSRRRLRVYTLFALFTFPNLLIMAVFAYWPAIGNLYLSFTQWDMVAPTPTFIALGNYRELLTDPAFGRVMTVTVIWVVVSVVISVGGGVGLAYLLNLRIRGRRIVSAIAFSPYVMPGVAVAAVWLFIFDPHYGLSRWLFSLVGADSPGWTASTRWALPALIIVALWKSIGFNALVYLAAMQTLPKDVYEAAALDGAGRWRMFGQLTWPLLSPTTSFIMITSTIASFQAFDLIAIMTGGGPGNATTTLSWFIYYQGFQAGSAGLAAAGGVIMFVILMALTAVQMRFVERRAHYQ